MKQLVSVGIVLLLVGCAEVTGMTGGVGGSGGPGGEGGNGGTNRSIGSSKLEVLEVKVGSRVMFAFDSDTLEYDLEVGQLARRLDLRARTEDPAATVEAAWRGLGLDLDESGSGLDVTAGVGTLRLDVTSSDGNETSSYQVRVTRRPDLVQTELIPGEFGDSVAAHQDTMVSGNRNTPNGGVARVFRRSGSGWTDEATLEGTNTEAGERFGVRVGVDGDTIIVGALFDKGALNDMPNRGGAYVFERSGATWSESAYLDSPDIQSGDSFGGDVAVSGDTVVVGAVGDDGVLPDSGAVYVFVKSGSDWVQEAKLKATNVGQSDAFGQWVDIDGDTIIVGAPREDGADDGMEDSSGAVYLFERSGSTWTGVRVKPPTPRAGELFGADVAIDGDVFVAGAPLAVEESGQEARGAAYIFSRSGGDWTLERRVIGSQSVDTDYFGEAVDIQGDVASIVATSTDPGLAKAYVFVRQSTNFWREEYVRRPDGVDELFFEILDVALEGDTLFIPSRGVPDGRGVAVFE